VLRFGDVPDLAHPLAAPFQGRAAPEPERRLLRANGALVTEIWSDQRDGVVTGTVPKDDAYILSLHLRPRPPGSMRAEGRWSRCRDFAAGNAGIVDLRMDLLSEYAGPFHYLTFYASRAALDTVAIEAEAPRVRDLRHRPGVGFADPIVRHLLLSLQPLLRAPAAEAVGLQIDHVSTAMLHHLARTYGEMRARPARVRGGLTPRQRRRAEELLDERLDGGVTLTELARACDLSTRHFARAFQQSTGIPPHRWLTERRIEKARDLLVRSRLSLREIAAACGFADQSHFTRTFTRATGSSPGAFRRERDS
jgi:AraC family transcriptional regulator